jgi:hypothetical protein
MEETQKPSLDHWDPVVFDDESLSCAGASVACPSTTEADKLVVEHFVSSLMLATPSGLANESEARTTILANEKRNTVAATTLRCSLTCSHICNVICVCSAALLSLDESL